MVLLRGIIKTKSALQPLLRIGNLHYRCTLPASDFSRRVFVKTHRNVSQNLADEESKQSWFSKYFFNPENSAFVKEEDRGVMSEEETDAREELLNRIQECYYKKPPEEPGIEFFVEAFNLLMKYNDWRSVESLVNLVEDQLIQLDDDFLDKIEDFLAQVKEKKPWY